MARKPSSVLTQAELRLMEVLWSKGTATVAQITEALNSPPLHYSTVLTTMRVLEKKGFVRHREDGRAYVYKPLVGPDAAASSALGQLLKHFFRGSPGALALKLVKQERLSREELSQLRELIDRTQEV